MVTEIMLSPMILAGEVPRFRFSGSIDQIKERVQRICGSGGYREERQVINKGDPYELNGRCYQFSRTLQKLLSEGGVDAFLVENKWHGFLECFTRDLTEVIIDPTIGQYIIGAKEVFVGTRNELKTVFDDRWRQVVGDLGVPYGCRFSQLTREQQEECGRYMGIYGGSIEPHRLMESMYGARTGSISYS